MKISPWGFFIAILNRASPYGLYTCQPTTTMVGSLAKQHQGNWFSRGHDVHNLCGVGALKKWWSEIEGKRDFSDEETEKLKAEREREEEEEEEEWRFFFSSPSSKTLT